uniref:RanBP2-type domain-containing protein n=1 Tax=Trichobilharzia regenti TaxID=157069 RepID=A0AA85JPP2_TRIRE|nr:unnamed protein product [Trichobilharzia regenti]
MEAKANDFHRVHRKLRSDDDDKWDCSVCTYINPKESYKCEICHTRKGTSTRKPRLNNQVVEQQQLIAQTILKEKDDEHKKKRESKCKQSVSSNFRLKHFDRSSPLLFEIFANGYSVIITEFQPKSSKSNSRSFSESPALSNSSSHHGFGVNPGNLADDISSTDSLTNVPITSRPHHLSTLSEYEFNDPMDIKPPKNTEYPLKSNFTITRSGPPSTEEPLRPCRSYSSASSSVGGNTLSRASSPHNSIDPCLSDVKKEQAALEAEQAAHDGDDECEEDENILKVRLSNESKQCSPSGTEQSKRSVLRSVSLNSSCPPQNRRGHRGGRLRCPPGISPLKRKKLTRGSSSRNTSCGNQSKGKVSNECNTLVPPIIYRSLRNNSNNTNNNTDKCALTISDSKKSSSKRFKKLPRQSDANCKPQKRQRFDELCGKPLTGNASRHEKCSKCAVLSSKPLIFPDVDDDDGDHYAPTIHSSPDLHKESVSTVVATPQTRPRLSTESKNTSAMTDSSGATALEMSS